MTRNPHDEVRWLLDYGRQQPIKHENFTVQYARARRLMEDYLAYAQSIGCKLGEGVFAGEIEATAVQATMLARWWHDRTGYTSEKAVTSVRWQSCPAAVLPVAEGKAGQGRTRSNIKLLRHAADCLVAFFRRLRA
jgi:hypothetical protein